MRPGAYLRVGHLSGAPLGYAPALIANIRPWWKGLPGTNTLAYYEHLQIMDVKSLITFAPGGNLIMLFSSSWTIRTNALAYSDGISSMKNKVL